MRINKIAFGNNNEAFIEGRLKENLNIIYSNDNNKGKTLLIQGLMYSIGYESIFPKGFNPREYYFYSSITFNDETFEFLRKKNSVIVKGENLYHICNSISELKYLFDRNIYKLPRILKNGSEKIADLTLFYELFFLGQDGRNTSNLVSKGLYNKVDFKNMLFVMNGIDTFENNKYDIQNLNDEKDKLKDKEKSLKKKFSLLKENPEIANFTATSADIDRFEKEKKIISDINHSIFEYKKQRTREQNRKNKLQNLLGELNSLNRNIDTGKVKCAICGSDKIIFSNEDFNFEVSNSFIRKQIINSIDTDINLKSEIIDELTRNINYEQNQLTKELELIPKEDKDFIIFKDEIIDNKVIDKEINEIKSEIRKIDNTLKLDKSNVSFNKNEQKDFIYSILSRMTYYYNQIDKEGTLVFDDIFTKKDETYSGSEEQEFYFCKMVALSDNLRHEFPIIIDSFRDGEISTNKENEMLKIFKKLGKQSIITATLKDEEYHSDKYEDDFDTNVLDYSSFQDSRILRKNLAGDFLIILESFGNIIDKEE